MNTQALAQNQLHEALKRLNELLNYPFKTKATFEEIQQLKSFLRLLKAVTSK